MGQEKRPSICIGTHFVEMFKFASVCLGLIAPNLQDQARTLV